MHRDIKPANLAVGRHAPASRFIYMLDFGLSREFVVKQGDKQVGLKFNTYSHTYSTIRIEFILK